MRPKALVLTAAFLALAAAPTAQQPAAPARDTGGRPPATTGTGVLTGTVTTFDGLPAVGARVSAGGEGGTRLGVTDARGRFKLTGLRPGRYFVSVSKPGFVSITYGQRRANTTGTPVPLTDGETREINIQLPRAGVITGMVLDENGEPVVNAFVRVMRFLPTGGERRPQQAGGDNTDDRGIYRVHSLQPGDYSVCVTFRGSGPQTDAQRIQQQIDFVRRNLSTTTVPAAQAALKTQLADLEAQLPDKSEPMTGYATVCSPGPSATSTTAIPLAVGEEKSGVDLQLHLTRVARVDGMLVVPSGTEPRSVQVALVNVDDPQMPSDRSFAEMHDVGRFSFQSVPPGRYTVVARVLPGSNMSRPFGVAPGPQSPPTPGLWANADIVVSGEDITGLAMELQPGAKLTGRVVFQGASPPSERTRAMITIGPAALENNPVLGSPTLQGYSEPDGTFTINDVFPGKYRVTATVTGAAPVAGGPVWVVQSIAAGDEDALDTPLEVDGRRSIGGLVVTMTDRLSEISGTLLDEKGKPATEQTLVLYSVDPKYWFYQSRRVRTTRAGEDGRYSFRYLPPGDYRLGTLTDPEPGSWYDKTVLTGLDATSVRVSIAEGEKKIENVRVK